MLCIVCGVFSIQFGGPARYMFFFLGSVLFWGDAASAPPSLSLGGIERMRDIK